jgi:thioredoxin reductase (NADPH)
MTILAQINTRLWRQKGARPTNHDMRRLKRNGRIVTYPTGTFLAHPGEPIDRFVYVEQGEIEVVNLPCTLGPTQFMGKIGLLNGGGWSLTMRAVLETRVIEVSREAILTLMSRVPELSDITITVFSARRRRQLDDRDGSLLLIGEDEDRNVRRIAEFANRNRIPYTSLPLRRTEAQATAHSCAIAAAEPAVIFGRGVAMTDVAIGGQAGASRLRSLAQELSDKRCYGCWPLLLHPVTGAVD